MSILNSCLNSFSQAGAKAPAQRGLGTKSSGGFFWRLISGAVLAGRLKALKVTSVVRHKRIQTTNSQFHLIPRSSLHSHAGNFSGTLFVITVVGLFFLSSACSTSAHRNQHILRILDRENDVLTAIQKDRAREELTAVITPNSTLSDSEMRLQRTLSELQEANKLVRQALEPQTKEKK